MAESTLQPEFTWRAHPARERLAQALLATLVIAAFAGLVYAESRSPWWAGGCALVLMLALNRFFFPSRFEIDGEGITAHYPLRRQRLRWSEVRRIVHDRRGAYLSRRAQASRQDAFTGMHLLLGTQAQVVLERIRSRCDRTPGVGDAS